MGLFGSFEPNLNDIDRPFEDKEKIFLMVKEFDGPNNWGNMTFTCVVTNAEKTGEHNGKEIDVQINVKENKGFPAKLRWEFCKCFWTEKQLVEDTYDVKDCLKKGFSCQISYFSPKDKPEKVYKNFSEFQPLGGQSAQTMADEVNAGGGAPPPGDNDAPQNGATW